MTDPVSTTTPSVAAADWRVWEKDRQRVEQEIVEGRPFQVWDTERGRFDALFDFLLRSGLWDAATAMRPSQLKKDNGIRYSLLNGLECLREMAGIDAPANCGPLLKDPYLLERIGFTAERIQNCLEKDRTVVDPETLLNHLPVSPKRIWKADFSNTCGSSARSAGYAAACMPWMATIS